MRRRHHRSKEHGNHLDQLKFRIIHKDSFSVVFNVAEFVSTYFLFTFTRAQNRSDETEKKKKIKKEKEKNSKT